MLEGRAAIKSVDEGTSGSALNVEQGPPTRSERRRHHFFASGLGNAIGKLFGFHRSNVQFPCRCAREANWIRNRDSFSANASGDLNRDHPMFSLALGPLDRTRIGARSRRMRCYAGGGSIQIRSGSHLNAQSTAHLDEPVSDSPIGVTHLDINRTVGIVEPMSSATLI